MLSQDISIIFNKLLELSDNEGVDVTKEVKDLYDGKIESSLILINKYDNMPLLEVYNKIYERRNSSPLYKNLLAEDGDISEKVLALSSFITQVLISSRIFKDKESKLEYYKATSVNTVTEAIDDFVSNGNETKVNDVFFDIQGTLRKLFKGE